MPAAPLLFLGDSATGEVWEFGAGPTDDGVAFVPLAKSARVAPAGIGGECIFTALYFAVTHRIINNNPVLVRVTPIINGVPQDGTGGTTDERKIVTLDYVGGARKTELFELGLSIPNIHLTIERGRHAMRGTWFQYLVEGTQLDAGAGELTFEVSELEYEIVRESTPEGG
jgi:hypothetical protein